MKKNLLILLLSLFTFSMCDNKKSDLITGKDDFLLEKSTILKNYSEGLTAFNKITHNIDSDIESYWGYSKADSILATIDKTGGNYFEDLTKLYSANTHMFYGMSYSNAVRSIAWGDDYSLEELIETIIDPLSGNDITYQKIAQHELASIYSLINFYKAGRMNSYDFIQSLFDENVEVMQTWFENTTENDAYRVISFENKKLYYKILFTYIFELYIINNPDGIDRANNEYIDQLVELGEKMDEITADYEYILTLSDAKYYQSVLKVSEIHREMFDLLIEQMNIMIEARANQS